MNELSEAEREAFDDETLRLLELATARPGDELLQSQEDEEARRERVRARIHEAFEAGPLDAQEIAALLERPPGQCAKCQERELRELVKLNAGIAVHESYTQEFTLADGSSATITWDIELARAAIRRRPRKAFGMNRLSLLAWLADKVTYDPDHVGHLPEHVLDEPGIVLTIDISESNKPEDLHPLRILVDGSHRAARKLREGRPFEVYHLTEQEQYAIAVYRVNGVVTPMSLVPGPGTTDEEAGLL